MSAATDFQVIRPIWTFDWERAELTRLADEVGFDLPADKPAVRAPATAEERDRFYEYWTYIAALDLFIFESCAHGILLAGDPGFRLFLTRQIGDDGFHAERFREQIEAVTGRDPLADMVVQSRRQWDIFGDLSKRSWLGFLAFELHYELYVVPSMSVNGRTSTVNDPRLVELAAERFFPDEVFHRSWVANWWVDHLRTRNADERRELVETLHALDDEGQERRADDLQSHWAAARAATGACNEGIEVLYDAWRASIQELLYAA